MITAIETCLHKYSDFSGRASRSEYWYFYLFVLIVDLVLSYSKVPIIDEYGSVVFLLPVFAAAARRMHDVGRSGWWMLMPIVNLVFLCSPTVHKD
jgi:uncharacterized membrane protein YhaH (DUF805 family)